MKFENTETWGLKHAIRGMRNPLESWNKSDSYQGSASTGSMYLGEADLKLMTTLIKAGNEHRKFMRQIMVSVDITAPLYWWKEFDTYKVGTVANSTSTMHRLASTPITQECFECPELVFKTLIHDLEIIRNRYLENKNKKYWKQLIINLPESWLQTRTVTMNYENILSMVKHRKTHKLTEWSESFINWVKTLPYSSELLFNNN